ncbi:MAG TPA: glycosyltransferase family 4 protein [Aridibacter sp.]|nr:glycosyltransferase family 4 protein [Aridibacter sp.]
MIFETALHIVVFAVSLGGIRAFIGWSRKRRILDVPNERSSHSRPVPVGAGLVIALTVLASLLVFLAFVVRSDDRLRPGHLAAYFIGATVLVAVSWLDDIRAVPVVVRFAIHSAAAVALIWASAGWIDAFGDLWWAGCLISFVWIVGLTNAYNFMDGIDGIAGIQAVTAGVGWGIIGMLSGADLVSFAGFSVTAASLAFLIFNWQPAKVFMGDSGSAFLGFSFAALPMLYWAERGTDPLVPDSPWLAGLMAVGLIWPFVLDSSMTFFRRLFRGERVWEPHRRHLYQAMVINGWSHGEVSTVYGVCGAACTAAVIMSALYHFSVYPLLAALAVVALLLLVFASLSGSGKVSGI